MRKPTKTLCVALCLMVISVVLPAPKAFGAVSPNQDLTAMSATMVFSIVSDMMRNPYDYVGETIKMKGLYSEFLDNNTGKTFHTCIVKDATACCAQGIEFELPEGVSYPPVDSEITIVGTMDTYRNESIHIAEGIDPTQYGIILDVCILRNAELLQE